MGRQVVAELLRGTATDVHSVWPSPKLSGDVIQHYGADGVEDPNLRRQLEVAASEVARHDRQMHPRDPRRIEQIKSILGQAGFDLNRLPLDDEVTAA